MMMMMMMLEIQSLWYPITHHVAFIVANLSSCTASEESFLFHIKCDIKSIWMIGVIYNYEDLKTMLFEFLF